MDWREDKKGSKVRVKDLIMPRFVVDGENQKQGIKTMPGVFRLSIDNLLEEVAEIEQLGVRMILLFGIPSRKDKQGSEAFAEKGIVQRAVRALKKKFPKIVVMTDVCLCAYTNHGHCGVLENQNINLAASVETLAKIAVSHAKAGADYVAPSAMMEGQVKVIRKALDDQGFKKTRIMGYSAKFASNFYGPFREATDCAPKFGDRSSYQLDFSNTAKALEKIEIDIAEGADIIMVKPALAYLDIIYQAKQKFNKPLAAYNVSGEYSLIYMDEKLVLEVLTAIKRAGADLIITYSAKEVAKWLREK